MAENYSSNNAWVEMYLTALLGDGLSKEYVQGYQQESEETKALYFFNKMIDDDEEAIIKSWRRAQATAGDPKDPMNRRREYQSWRIWGLKRARAAAAASDSGALDMVVPPTLETADSSTLPSLGSSWDVGRSHPISNLAPVKTRPAGDTTPSGNDAVLSPGTGRSMFSTETVQPENPFTGRVDKLHLVLISAHGLVRGENMELGRDADTGGQVKYVVELARTLSHHPMVHRVDLITRLIRDGVVGTEYGCEEELIGPGAGSYGGAYIIRVPAGDPKIYLAKEQLWPHLRELADHGLAHVQRIQKAMHESSEPCNLYAVHGHYADAGEVAALMSHTLGVPMILTGHSLGRNKLDHLKRSGKMSVRAIEETYRISRRIEGEERALDAALMVITSTQQEVDLQWGLYDGYREALSQALRTRPIPGHAMPQMQVIPPGLDFSSLKVELPADPMQLFEDCRKAMTAPSETLHANVEPPSSASHGGPADPFGPSDLRDEDLLALGQSHALDGGPSVPSLDPVSPGSSSVHASRSPTGGMRGGLTPPAVSGGASLRGVSRSGSRAGGLGTRVLSSASLATMERELYSEPDIWKSVNKFLQMPAKPVVLAMSRPDTKKNIATLVRAFGSDPTLRELANLVLIMGNRSNIDNLAGGSQQVLMEVLKLIDEYDLYGCVAYPKAHTQADISDIYLLAQKTRGVFVNIALQEPFGLTLIEAAVHGAPIVATKHGGPVDIVRTLKNGVVVEPTDERAVAGSILDIILHKDKWHRYSTGGIKNILAYSWPSHCIKFLELVERALQGEANMARCNTRRRGRHSIDLVSAGIGEYVDGVLGGTEARPKVAPGSAKALAGLATSMDDLDIMRPSTLRVGPDQPSAMDDLMIESHHRSTATGYETTQGGGSTLRLSSKKRLVYATLDTTYDLQLLAQALRTIVQCNDGSLALGLLSLLTFTELCRELEAVGIDPTSLDFLICNCGAYILFMDTDGATWHADEAWESKVSHRWDKRLMMRALMRMQVSRASQNHASASASDVEKTSDVMRLLTAADGIDVNDGNGPLHVLLELDPAGDSPLQRLDNATLIEKVRKKTRHAALRCNLTLQLIPHEENGGGGGEAAGATRPGSVLHATPLRASRALALRHLVRSHDFDMSEALFVCTPASMHAAAGGGTMLGSLCSDLTTLVEGAQRVIVVPPQRLTRLSQALDEDEMPASSLMAGGVPRGSGSRDVAAFERLRVSLVAHDPKRVRVLQDASNLRSSLEQLLAGGEGPAV